MRFLIPAAALCGLLSGLIGPGASPRDARADEVAVKDLPLCHSKKGFDHQVAVIAANPGHKATTLHVLRPKQYIPQAGSYMPNWTVQEVHDKNGAPLFREEVASKACRVRYADNTWEWFVFGNTRKTDPADFTLVDSWTRISDVGEPVFWSPGELFNGAWVGPWYNGGFGPGNRLCLEYALEEVPRPAVVAPPAPPAVID